MPPASKRSFGPRFLGLTSRVRQLARFWPTSLSASVWSGRTKSCSPLDSSLPFPSLLVSVEDTNQDTRCDCVCVTVIDIYIYSVVFKDMKLGGVLLILCGFLVVLLPVNWNEYLTSIFRNRLAKWKRREEKKKTIVRGQQQQQQQDATSTGQLSRLRTSSGRVK